MNTYTLASLVGSQFSREEWEAWGIVFEDAPDTEPDFELPYDPDGSFEQQILPYETSVYEPCWYFYA